MNKVKFLVATYNEEQEIPDLLYTIKDIADYIFISDDGSTDATINLAYNWQESGLSVVIIQNSHIGLPETIKARGIEAIVTMFGPDVWVLMLDADERVSDEVRKAIQEFINSNESLPITHVWFNMQEFIDGISTRFFQKCRLFRAGFAYFSQGVHEDDRFDGQGANFNWPLIHRKTSDKQKMREKEYLETYKKLLNEGKVTQEWVDRCIGFHYFIKE